MTATDVTLSLHICFFLFGLQAKKGFMDAIAEAVKKVCRRPG